jgi:hypothetical protein
VRCDLLVISGHFDGGNHFYADGDPPRSMLSVSELERASCSASCAGVFGALREVYLFGCNTLSSRPLPWTDGPLGDASTTGPPPVPDPRTRPVQGESARDRLRQIFDRVPLLYGFEASAPLGPAAATALDRAMRKGALAAVGSGKPNASLLAEFAALGMVTEAGWDARASRTRWDVCRVADPREQPSNIVRYLHELVRQDIAAVSEHIHRWLGLVDWLRDQARSPGETATAFESLTGDASARREFLAFAHRTVSAPDRARLLGLARAIGWLSDAEHREEAVRLLREIASRPTIGLDELGLACTIDRSLAPLSDSEQLALRVGAPDSVAHAALLACTGAAPERQRTLAALASDDPNDVLIGAAFLSHRPTLAPLEWRALVEAVGAMTSPQAQTTALEALGRSGLSDATVVARLGALYSDTPFWSVQNAIAGLLLRAEAHAWRQVPGLAPMLRDRRLPGPQDRTLVDALLERLADR